MDLECRNQKGRIPGSRQSMKGYILTHSMVKKKESLRALVFQQSDGLVD